MFMNIISDLVTKIFSRNLNPMFLHIGDDECENMYVHLGVYVCVCEHGHLRRVR